MTDILFSNMVPIGHELGLIQQICYIPEAPQGDFFHVKVVNMISNVVVEVSIMVPAWYHEHIECFLWCHWVFMGVEQQSEPTLKHGIHAMLQ